ncbi:hypothetical protein IJX73_06215 [bacterium]|nr:hypothetical protein [bacterium]
MTIFSQNSIFLNWQMQKYGVSLYDMTDVGLYSNLKYIKEFLSDKYNIDDSVFSKSVNEVLSYNFDDNTQEVLQDENMQAESSEELAEAAEALLDSQSPEFMDLLSEILSNDEMTKLIDGDLDSELSNEEIGQFIEKIKGLDGQDDNVSLNDLLLGIENLTEEQILDLPTSETLDEENLEENVKEKTENIQKTKKASLGRKTYSSGDGVEKINEKNLQTMDDEALEAELQARKQAFDANNNLLNNLSNGSDSTLNSLKTNMDTSFAALEEQLNLIDSDLANELTNAKNNVDSQQVQVDKLNLSYTNQQVLVSQLTNQYTNAQTRLSTLKATQIELNSINVSELEPQEAQEIAAKKQKIAIEIKNAAIAEQNALSAKQKAEAELISIQDEKTKNENLLQTYKDNLSTIETNISNAHPQLATLQNNYSEAKNAYYDYKDTQITNAQKAVLESQNAVNEVETVQSSRKLKNEVKDLSPNPLSQYDEEWGRIISEAAKKYASEGHSTSCGASVRKVLESLGYDYIQKCKGKEWAETNLVNSPDFVEVEFSLEDIKAGNVPIGSICCFSEYDSFGYGDGKSGHVGIVIDNNGSIAEASGYIRKAGINTNIIELGHGTVRIFVPTNRPS